MSEDKACKWGGCNGTVPAKGGNCNRCGHITYVLTTEEQALVDLYTD